MTITNETKYRNPLIEVEIFPYIVEGIKPFWKKKDVSSDAFPQQPLGEGETVNFGFEKVNPIPETKFNNKANILPKKIFITNQSINQLGAMLVGFKYSTNIASNGIGNFSMDFKLGKISSISELLLENNQLEQLAYENINIFEYLRTESLIKVRIDGVFIFVGLIKKIDLGIRIADKSVSISGENTGCLLKMPMFYDFSQGAVLDNDYLTKGRAYNQRVSGSISSMVNNILTLWLKNVLDKSNFKFASGGLGALDKIKPSKFKAFTSNLKSLKGDVQKFYSSILKGETTNILDFFDMETGDERELYLNNFPYNPSLWDYEGELLSYINQLISTPFNELYVVQGDSNITIQKASTNFESFGEAVGEKMFLVLRQTPFDDFRYMSKEEMKSRTDEAIPKNLTPEQFDEFQPAVIETEQTGIEFKDLIKFEISEDEIITENLSKSSQEMYSYFSCTLVEQLISQDISKILQPPIYNYDALNRLGYKPLNLVLSSLSEKELRDSGQELFNTINTFQKKARQWYGYNDEYLSGSLTIKGFARLQIGESLIVKEKLIEEVGAEFYIDGYNHDWNIGSDFKSTVNVSRGIGKAMKKRFSQVNQFRIDKKAGKNG